ncbi:MAG: lytic transglycosylase domain-containing protein [Lysobacteraceae bacterium]
MKGFYMLIAILLLIGDDADARTVYRCVRGSDVSLATAPEPGSRCEARQLADDAPTLPNLWGSFGAVSGVLYQRQQDGQNVYSTRNLPGSTPVLSFTVPAPKNSPAHVGLGNLGLPRLDVFAADFRDASRATGVEDALLRAIAHAESAFDASAVSAKGAQGVMQLIPDTAKQFAVVNPFSAKQSIGGGAHYLKQLLRRYKGNHALAVAAYNAGSGAVDRYHGIPPYAETQQYVAKVQALYLRYQAALNRPAH